MKPVPKIPTRRGVQLALDACLDVLTTAKRVIRAYVKRF